MSQAMSHSHTCIWCILQNCIYTCTPRAYWWGFNGIICYLNICLFLCHCNHSASTQASFKAQLTPRTYKNTYIGVWRKGFFVLTAPPLRLRSSLRGGVASWRALAVLVGLTVCRRGRLTLKKQKSKKEGMKMQTHTLTPAQLRPVMKAWMGQQIIKHILFRSPALYKDIKHTHPHWCIAHEVEIQMHTTMQYIQCTLRWSTQGSNTLINRKHTHTQNSTHKT